MFIKFSTLEIFINHSVVEYNTAAELLTASISGPIALKQNHYNPTAEYFITNIL